MTYEIYTIIYNKSLKKSPAIAVTVAVEVFERNQFQEKPKWPQSSVPIWHLCMPKRT